MARAREDRRDHSAARYAAAPKDQWLHDAGINPEVVGEFDPCREGDASDAGFLSAAGTPIPVLTFLDFFPNLDS